MWGKGRLVDYSIVRSSVRNCIYASSLLHVGRVIQCLAMWVCCAKSISQFLTAYRELRIVYIPHASRVSVVFLKLFC